MNIDTVFKIYGFEMKTLEGNFMENCAFWVYAKTKKEALSKVKNFGVKKKFYQVIEVIEKKENVCS